GEAALHQTADQVGDLGDVFHVLREHVVGAIEIGTEADVVDAGDLHGVLEVVQETSQGDAAKLGDALGVDLADGGAIPAAVTEIRRLAVDRILARLLVFQGVFPVIEAGFEKTFVEVNVYDTALGGDRAQ